MNDMKKVLIVAISVVLVIAIAAGVSIGVMANTMNGLKDKVAELDQAYASDMAAMKAEIEAAKAANENLVTAADFEAKLAAALGEQNQTMQSLISTAVKNQIEELGTEGLTEAQVQEIIDAAVANCLTEADIDAIIADANTGLTKDEVKKIVADYTAGTLTYGQIVDLIEDEAYALRKFLEDKIGEVAGDLGDLEQSTSSYVVSGKTVTIKSTKGLIDWAKDTDNGKSWDGYTVNLEVDVDLAGVEWNPIDTKSFITFNGNGHTISNLSVEGYQYSGFFGCTGAIVVKNVTFNNANVKALAGDQTWAGVVAGSAQTIVAKNYSAFSNITVKNSTVYGEDKCGGLFGLLNEYDMTMNNIVVSGCTIGSEKADAAGGVVGRVGAIMITVENFTYNNNTLVAKNDNKGEIDGKNSRTTVETAADLSTALANGGYVVLENDIDAGGQVFVNNGATFDGNGKTITVNSGSAAYESGLTVTKGTVKNITVTGAFRGLGVGGSGASEMTGNVTYENVKVIGATYGINIGVGNGYKLTMNNCTYGDWNSYSGLSSAEFNNCTFTSEGAYYASQRISANATFTYNNCEFNQNTYNNTNGSDNYYLDSYGNGTIVLNNCTVDGVLVTEDNVNELFGITDKVTVIVK